MDPMSAMLAMGAIGAAGSTLGAVGGSLIGGDGGASRARRDQWEMFNQQMGALRDRGQQTASLFNQGRQSMTQGFAGVNSDIQKAIAASTGRFTQTRKNVLDMLGPSQDAATASIWNRGVLNSSDAVRARSGASADVARALGGVDEAQAGTLSSMFMNAAGMRANMANALGGSFFNEAGLQSQNAGGLANAMGSMQFVPGQNTLGPALGQLGGYLGGLAGYGLFAGGLGAGAGSGASAGASALPPTARPMGGSLNLGGIHNPYAR